MCNNTSKHPDMPGLTLRCRKCDPCRMKWRKDWTGRLLAEAKTSQEVWFATLTYGGGYDNPQAVTHNKSHVAALFDQLRKHGHDVRYYGVGEFGEERGRAHWHLLIFWKCKAPPMTFDDDVMWEMPVQNKGRYAGVTRHYWPFGHVYMARPISEQACVAYTLKYMEKQESSALRLFAKRPAIGQEYLLELARRHARQGLALFPKGQPTYVVEGNVKSEGPQKGQLWDYWLDTKSTLFDRMITAYVVEWTKCRRNQIMPFDKFITRWAEDLTYDEQLDLVPDAVRTHLTAVERLMTRRIASVRGQIAYWSVDWDEELLLFLDVPTGAMELRWVDEDGQVTWRKSVEGNRDKILRQRPPGVAPRRGTDPELRRRVRHDPPPVPKRERSVETWSEHPPAERQRLRHVTEKLSESTTRTKQGRWEGPSPPPPLQRERQTILEPPNPSGTPNLSRPKTPAR